MTKKRRRKKRKKMNEKDEEIIKAAGGLVWKEADGLKEIGVIRRSRYNEKGWTLPKGKLMKGESWEEAAIREVCEEIGCDNEDLIIENFAGGIVYPVEGKPKVVLFWNMKFREKHKEKKVDKEVKEINWLPIKLAIDNMEYPKEAELLKKILHRR